MLLKSLAALSLALSIGAKGCSNLTSWDYIIVVRQTMKYLIPLFTILSFREAELQALHWALA
jgi:hypothetical protein